MSKLARSVQASISALVFAACTHDQPPPAVPESQPHGAAEPAPSDAPPPPPASADEKKSNDASGSSSPMPDR